MRLIGRNDYDASVSYVIKKLKLGIEQFQPLTTLSNNNIDYWDGRSSL